MVASAVVASLCTNVQEQHDSLSIAVKKQQVSINCLQREAVERREEVASLLECLSDAGVLRPATFYSTLHRRRFTALREFDRAATKVHFEDTLRLDGAALLIANLAGPTAVCAACAVSRSVGRVACESWPSLNASCAVSVYMLGGKDQRGCSMNSVERFNHRSSTWEALPPIATPRYGACAGVVSAKIYVCGGSDGKVVQRSVERFDPGGNAWETVTPMLRERVGAVASVIHNRLYVGGGSSGSHLSLASAESFNVAAEVWQALPPMAHERASPSGGILPGGFYVCGGEGFEEQYWDSVECFDLAIQGWRPAPSLLEARTGAAAASVAGRLFICGGWSSLGQVLSSVECLDEEVGVWEQVARMPSSRSGIAATAAAGHIFLFGGFAGSAPLADVQRYDPNAPSMMSARGVSAPTAWAALPAMELRRELAAAVTAPG